jgi:hypothetical protein
VTAGVDDHDELAVGREPDAALVAEAGARADAAGDEATDRQQCSVGIAIERNNRVCAGVVGGGVHRTDGVLRHRRLYAHTKCQTQKKSSQSSFHLPLLDRQSVVPGWGAGCDGYYGQAKEAVTRT